MKKGYELLFLKPKHNIRFISTSVEVYLNKHELNVEITLYGFAKLWAGQLP